jgi:hypothetical protein
MTSSISFVSEEPNEPITQWNNKNNPAKKAHDDTIVQRQKTNKPNGKDYKIFKDEAYWADENKPYNQVQNKSWIRPSDDSKKKGQRELAVFIKNSIQKELNLLSAKKRKAGDNADNESIKSTHMAEVQELAAFNLQLW